MNTSEAKYGVRPGFKKRYDEVRAHYFSRSSRFWPVFADAAFRRIIAFREQHHDRADCIGRYPEGPALHERLLSEAHVPETSMVPGAEADHVLAFAAALSKNWEDPASVENVIAMPCDPGIYGAMIGTLVNPNLVYSEYAGMADALEKNVIRQIANLAGYDESRATGIFTQGGTLCNLYGYLAGIRKAMPEAKEYGMGHVHDYRFINSAGGHYSNITNLSLLGADIRKKVIRIRLLENNDIDLRDLEDQLAACFNLRCVVPAIMLTMGTTDTFAVDRVKPVCDLVKRLCEHYEVPVKPHIHVDSAIGWSMLFFLAYDFDNNPLCINEATLEGLRINVERFSELRYADSFTVDFQKWGYVPYTSSLVMFKDREDLVRLENDPDNFSYFERDVQGKTHLQSTIECSRGAAGLFGAYAALKYMGVEGYQVILAHCLQNANLFRSRLSAMPNVKVLAPGNHGPSVGFRVYNPAVVKDAQAEFEREYAIRSTPEYRERLSANNTWHRRLFLTRGKAGLYTNWVEFSAHTDYDEKGRFHKLPGEKAVFMNPLTSQEDIDGFIGKFQG